LPKRFREVTYFSCASFKAVNSYCVIKCADEKVKSNIVENNSDPVWKQFSAVFYRSKKLPPVEIQVIKTLLCDDISSDRRF